MLFDHDIVLERTGQPDEKVCHDIAAIHFVKRFVPAAGIESVRGSCWPLHFTQAMERPSLLLKWNWSGALIIYL